MCEPSAYNIIYIKHLCRFQLGQKTREQSTTLLSFVLLRLLVLQSLSHVLISLPRINQHPTRPTIDVGYLNNVALSYQVIDQTSVQNQICPKRKYFIQTLAQKIDLIYLTQKVFDPTHFYHLIVYLVRYFSDNFLTKFCYATNKFI